MAVLVEALSVILRCDSLEKTYRDGVAGFAEFCRTINNSYCCDGELVRMGFTRPEEVGRFIERVGLLGLVHVRQGQAIDLVVADQRGGLLQSCDWADFGLAQLPAALAKGSTTPPKVAACRRVGAATTEITVPEGWRWEKSISRQVARADEEEAKWARKAAPKPGLAGLYTKPAAPPLADILGLSRPKK